jgi:hypothetical protein
MNKNNKSDKTYLALTPLTKSERKPKERPKEKLEERSKEEPEVKKAEDQRAGQAEYDQQVNQLKTQVLPQGR